MEYWLEVWISVLNVLLIFIVVSAIVVPILKMTIETLGKAIVNMISFRKYMCNDAKFDDITKIVKERCDELTKQAKNEV